MIHNKESIYNQIIERSSKWRDWFVGLPEKGSTATPKDQYTTGQHLQHHLEFLNEQYEQ